MRGWPRWWPSCGPARASRATHLADRARREGGSMHVHAIGSSLVVVVAALLAAACAGPAPRDVALAGKPLDEFVNDLKDELADVHWRVRGPGLACGGGALREVDLRQAAITLSLERIAQVGASGDVRLVALPLGVGAIEPTLAADVERRVSRTLVVRLEAGGDAPVVDAGRATASTRPVAQALNAAIDGFMRSSPRDPCVRLAGLKLTLILDVEANGSGGFRITVPALRAGVDATGKAVNTLTLDWSHVSSNGFL